MKSRMKRLFLLGLAAALMMGCGAKEEIPAVEETPEIIVEEVETPEVAETDEVTPEKTPLTIKVDTYHKNYYFENGEDAYLYLQYCDVTVDGNDYTKLQRNVENWSLERSEGLRSLYTTFEETAGAEEQDLEGTYGYSLYQNVSIARADSAIVSLLDDTWQYMGGEDSIFFREGVNFDSQSGKRLKLEDLFYDYDAFVEDAMERIIYELREVYGEELNTDYISVVEGLWNESAEPEWYVDASGIVIVLQENSVGPKTVGTPEIHLPYAEFESYIKETYFPGELEGVASFQQNEEVFLSLQGIEEEIPMMLVSEMQDDEMYNSLWLGQNELHLDSFVVIEAAYLVRHGEEVFCLLAMDMASDDYVTYVYRLTNGVIEKVNEIEAELDAGNINPHQLSMESRIYLLGTYSGIKNYYFDKNAQLVTDEEEYRLLKNEFVLTTKTDLSILMDENESVLPAGSHIILKATDGESYVKFLIQETGQMGTLYLEERNPGDYGIYIDGMNENDCFEILPYAG